MYWTFDETTSFITTHYDHLLQLARRSNTNIILCPSHPALYPLSVIFKESPLSVGAQDCSEHHQGAFTGQVSANYLKTTGCSYCIIGHSERRNLLHESNQAIASKCLQLLQADITPILCIGETKEQADRGQTLSVLQEQLDPILARLHTDAPPRDNNLIIVAYEPVWAIGSGNIPSLEHLSTVYAWIAKTTATFSAFTWKHIYGGSVTSSSIQIFKQITSIHGFLIGHASLDFQEFEKIVKYHKDDTL